MAMTNDKRLLGDLRLAVGPPPRLCLLPSAVPLEGAVRIEIDEGVSLFKA